MKVGARRALIAGAVLAVIGATYLVTRDGGVAVSTATAVRDTLSVSIGVEGRTRPRDLYTVTAPASGRLARIRLEEGAEVGAGDTVARMLPTLEDPRTLATLRANVDAARAAYLEAESGVEQARIRASQARREADRRAALTDAGGLSREAIEQAELQARVAERTLEAARATLQAAAARRDAAETRLLGAAGDVDERAVMSVTSPVSGHVLQIPDASERVVSAGMPLVELADVRGLEVVFDVLSEDAVRIEPGQALQVTEWGGDAHLTGTVRVVTRSGYTKVSALGVEEQRVDVIGDLDEIPGSLGAGYRVAGNIVVWRGEDVLTVPTSAIFRSDRGWVVYTVSGGRAQRTEVEIGRRNPERAEVTAGLQPGAEVVLFPPAALEDGSSVRVEDRSP